MLSVQLSTSLTYIRSSPSLTPTPTPAHNPHSGFPHLVPKCSQHFSSGNLNFQAPSQYIPPDVFFQNIDLIMFKSLMVAHSPQGLPNLTSTTLQCLLL